MFKRLLAAMVGGFLLSASVSSPGQAQLVNGNFDAVVGTLQGWDSFGVNASPFGSLSQPQNATFNAFDDRLSQTVNLANAGRYVLSFFLKTSLNVDGGPPPFQNAFLQLLVNGALVAVGGANAFGYVQTTSFEFTMNAGDNLIRFTNAQFFGGAELLRLDNVVLTEVPGPLVGSGLASFALAGVGVLVARLRRRRSVAAI